MCVLCSSWTPRTHLLKRAICTRNTVLAIWAVPVYWAPLDSSPVQMATSKFVLCPNASAFKVVTSPNKTIKFGSHFKLRALPPNGSASSCASRGVSHFHLVWWWISIQLVMLWMPFVLSCLETSTIVLNFLMPDINCFLKTLMTVYRTGLNHIIIHFALLCID